MQPTRRLIIYAFILILGLSWIAISVDHAGASTGRQIAAPQKGFQAPDFSLQTRDGQTVTLSALTGQVILINFWASWCPPCQAEMPAIQNTYDTYKDQGLVLLAVNATHQDNQADMDRFITQNNLTFPILLDPDGTVYRLFAIHSLPTSFFIGRDGAIREVVIGGPMAEALLSTQVEKLLREQP